jgi:phosphoglycerate dehydrogenase-like enzyme
MRIVIPDVFYPPYRGHPQLQRLRQLGEVVAYDDQPASQDQLGERLAGAAIAINVCRDTQFDARVVGASPVLRLISVRGYDTDQIDLAAASAQGVVVTNVPGGPSTSVAEMGIALLLAAARQLVVIDREVREGKWPRRDGTELRGKTMGILGLGSIGLETARLGNGLGMRVIAWSPTHDPERARTAGVQLVAREDLLRQADAVFMCLRVHPNTVGAIGARELALMKPSVILINTARAALVDEGALVKALRERRIAAAGLDVYEHEPLPSGHPLLGLENAVLSPHSGSWTHEATERLMAVPVDNIIAYLQGEPQHVVNPDSLNHPRQRR